MSELAIGVKVVTDKQTIPVGARTLEIKNTHGGNNVTLHTSDGPYDLPPGESIGFVTAHGDRLGELTIDATGSQARVSALR